MSDHIAVTRLGQLDANGIAYPYVSWESRARARLASKGVLVYAEGKVRMVPVPDIPTASTHATNAASIDAQAVVDYDTAMAKHVEWALKDDLAKSIIQQLVSENQDATIRKAKSSHEAWIALKTAHEGAFNGITSYFVKTSLFERKYDPSDSLIEHMDAMVLDNKRLTASGEGFNDITLAQLILFSMPKNVDQWETLTVSLLQNATTSNPLTSETVISSLKQENARLKKEATSASALNARVATSASSSTSHARSRPYDGVKCSYCDIKGHIAKDCRRKMRDEKEKVEKRGKGKKKAMKTRAETPPSTDDSDSESDAVPRTINVKLASAHAKSHKSKREVIFLTANLAKTSKDEVNMDSGASWNVTPQRSWFDEKTFRKLDSPIEIHVADSNVILATGIGDLLYNLDTPSGSTRGRFERTLFVPDISTTLISVSQLTRSGKFRVEFTKDRCDIIRKHDGHVTGVATQTPDHLYRLNGSPVVHAKAAAVTSPVVKPKGKPISMELLHQRLGHLNEQDINRLIRDGLVDGANVIKGALPFCESCVHGKQHRSPFPSKTRKVAKEKLELVHSDVCGPFTTSMGGKKYFVTWIDDCTRKPWVYSIAKKSDVFATFKEWHVMVERESGHKVKWIQVDNGGEYIDGEFLEYLKVHGIQIQFNAPYNPETNGLAERANRTLVEAVLTMLHDSGLSSGFWAETLDTAVYLIGCRPASGLKGKTPDEAWYNKKRDISRLRRFGCAAYAYVDKKKRKKSRWDYKSRKCILLGYERNTRNYKLWDKKTHKIVRARHVIFDENSPASSAPDIADLSKFFWPENTPNVSSTENMGGIQASPLLYVSDSEDESDDDPQAPAIPAAAPAPPVAAAAPPAAAAAPPAVAQKPRARRRTELELLGPQELMTGPRRARHKITEVVPEPEVPEPDPNDTFADDDLAAHIAYVHVTVDALDNDGNITFSLQASTKSADEPQHYNEAMRSKDRDEWYAAVTKEIGSLETQGTWGPEMDLPKGKKVIGSRFVFKIKRTADGSIEKFKARLVAKGFTQTPNDYGETFAPVVKFTTIRVLLALAAKYNLDIHQLDYETAYLNAPVKEELYIRLPGSTSGKVRQLLRAIYGLKQAGREWNDLLNDELVSLGWERCQSDTCLYVYRVGKVLMFLAVYVDDLVLLGNNPKGIRRMKKLLGRRFKIKDLGEVSYLLGVKISRNRSKQTIELSQKKYIRELGERFGQLNAKPANTPFSSGFVVTKEDSPKTPEETADMAAVPYQGLIGGLMYAALCTRPDISFAVGALSKVSSNPGRAHFREAIRVLRYLLTTQDHKLTYNGKHSDPHITPGVNQLVHGFTDSDWAGNVDNRKSTGGYVFLMAGAAVSWSSKLQPTVALSSTEAEYVGIARAGQEVLWMRKLLLEIGELANGAPILTLADNQGSMALARNPGDHPRTKHIAIKYHFCRELVASKVMDLRYVPTESMTADILTKGLGRVKHELFVGQMGVLP